MAEILLVDDSAALSELFARTIEHELGHRVYAVQFIADLGETLTSIGRLDLALVDLSFPGQDASGLDALVEIERSMPTCTMAIITQGDEYVADLLRDAWELLPVVTVISKSAPLAHQLRMIDELINVGTAPPDPAVQPLLPRRHPHGRTAESFRFLVQHAGHAKLWLALLTSPEASYKVLADLTGLKLNTLKNYRAQLVDELERHGLHDPTLREMGAFAVRCRPFLRPFLLRHLPPT